MQEMIKRILEMDEQARQLTEDASSMRMQAEMTVEEKSQALKDEYLTRARKKVEQLEEKERGFAEEEWEQTQKTYAGVMDSLDRTAERNKDAWIKTIVNRTLGRAPHEAHLLPRGEMLTWPDNNTSAW